MNALDWVITWAIPCAFLTKVRIKERARYVGIYNKSLPISAAPSLDLVVFVSDHGLPRWMLR
jgi:hypothetical protein